MSGLPWYKRDPEAFIRGCADGQLTLEEVGAYALILDEMYRRGGPIIDDARAGCALLRCDVRVWHRLRAALIRKGKIYATGGKFLSNVRVESELKTQYDMREQKSRAGRLSAQLRDSYRLATRDVTPKSAPKSLDIKESVSTQPTTHAPVDIDIEYVLPTGVVGSVEPTSIDEPIAKAMQAYNLAADRAGWVRARMPIGAQRRRQVRARLKAMGIEGWLALIAEAEAQPFLGGVNDRGWRLDLDFLASERGSTKILEGKYRKPGEARAAEPDWPAFVAIWRENGGWPSALGPKPNEPGYRGPPIETDLFTTRSQA